MCRWCILPSKRWCHCCWGARRNTSLMLFTVVLQKVLGMKRVKDDRSAVNSITVREFMERYDDVGEGILKSTHLLCVYHCAVCMFIFSPHSYSDRCFKSKRCCVNLSVHGVCDFLYGNIRGQVWEMSVSGMRSNYCLRDVFTVDFDCWLLCVQSTARTHAQCLLTQKRFSSRT